MSMARSVALAGVFVCVACSESDQGKAASAGTATTADAAAAGDAVPEAASPGPVISFDCGTINPQLVVDCAFGGTPPTRLADALDATASFTADAAATSGRIEIECALDPAEDPGRTTVASYAASCDPGTPAADALDATLVIDGHAERECGTGENGSAARAAPEWHGAVSLPEARSYRIQLTATVTEVPEGCSLTVDGTASDPFVAGTAPVFDGTVTGPAEVPVVFKCIPDQALAFVGTACYGFNPNDATYRAPVTRDQHLKLEIQVR